MSAIGGGGKKFLLGLFVFVGDISAVTIFRFLDGGEETSALLLFFEVREMLSLYNFLETTIVEGGLSDPFVSTKTSIGLLRLIMVPSCSDSSELTDKFDIVSLLINLNDCDSDPSMLTTEIRIDPITEQ